MRTIAVDLSMDATAYGTSPTKNWSTQTYVTVAQGGNGRRTFGYAPLPLPLGVRIHDAYVEFTQERAATSATRILNLENVVARWDERTLTWNNAPAVGDIDSFVTVTGTGAKGRVIRFNTVAHMQAVADGAPWYGFRLTSSSPEILPLFSRKSSVGRPRLVVVYSEAPQKPTRLSPSGGRAVSIARPQLSFDFTDTAGNTDMAAYRLQLFEPGFSASLAPAVVTGKIVSYNVYGGYGGNWPTRLPQVIADLYATDADIILLQEAHEGPGEHLQILNGLNAAGRNYILAGGSGGNFILLKVGVYAIAEPVKTYRMPHSRDMSTMKVVHVPTGQTHGVWNLHLIANDQPKRADQMRFALPIILALGPSVGGGDLNNDTAFVGSPLQQAALAGVIETRTIVETVTNGQLRSKKNLPFGTPTPADGKWLDHIFVALGVVATAVGLTDTGDHSDHNLIWTEYQLVTGVLLAVESLGAPILDTQQVDSTTPVHELTEDIELDTALLWRVQTMDGAGLWSEWSDVASFTRIAKPTITIINPAAAPDDYVTEATPPIIWSTSGIQTGYHVLITDPDDHTNILWQTLPQGGATTSVTPSTNLPLQVDQVYRLEVRSDDDQIREGIPGDPTYAVAERLFTFKLSSSVDPVTSVTVHQADERPWMSVDIVDPTAADFYEILRRPVNDRWTSIGTFAALDLHHAGTTYRFVDRAVPPLRQHEWQVRRVVNGVTSAGKTGTGKVKAVGAWLCSLDGQYAMKLTTEGSSDPISWTANELVDIVAPLDGDRVYPVVDGTFGRTGVLNAFVKPWKGQTLDEARAAVDAMRPPRGAPYGTPMALTQVDECVHVFWVGVVPDRRHEYVEKFKIDATLHEVPRDAS